MFACGSTWISSTNHGIPMRSGYSSGFLAKLRGPILKDSQIPCHFFCCKWWGARERDFNELQEKNPCRFARGLLMSFGTKVLRDFLSMLESKASEVFFSPWANSPFLNRRSTLLIFFLQHLEHNDSFLLNRWYIYICLFLSVLSFCKRMDASIMFNDFLFFADVEIVEVCTVAGHLGRRCLVSWRVVTLRRSWSLFIQLV